MAFAILRVEKLKTHQNIAGSLAHNYRTRETPNADDERAHLNQHDLPSVEHVKAAIKTRIPEKHRKDAVLCLEYFIGASPEYFTDGQDRGRLRKRKIKHAKPVAAVYWRTATYAHSRSLSKTVQLRPKPLESLSAHFCTLVRLTYSASSESSYRAL
jgi:hypothetical protein